MRVAFLLLASGLCAGLQAGEGPLAARVAADFPSAAANAAFLHYAVPAMSELQRLPEAYPGDGVAGGEVRITAAREEYEPGSFLVWGNRDLGKVDFSLTAFRTDSGEVFPAGDLDLKVIKIWYQNRNAWFSYFGDTGFKLVPELLLNDEDLIRVDEEKQANYARLTAEDGRTSEFWLNPPRQFDSRMLRDPRVTVERFHCMRPDFDDADSLRPVRIEKGRFKQFFLTVHVRRDTKAGIYRGAVRVGNYGEILVAIRVLDFTLPPPKCYGDPTKDFLVSSYNYINRGNIEALNGFDSALARRQFVAVLKNQVAHNQTMHMVGGNADAMAFDCLEVMREAGMRMDVIQGAAGPTGAAGEESRARARRIADEFDRRYGHHNVFLGYGDEPSPAWLVKARPVYEDYQSAGLRFFIAGHNAVFYKAGYLYDWHNTASDPTDSRVVSRWNALQNGNRVAWYANQHVGAENPALNRRQNGLAAYLSGYTALCNYAHHLGPYNDDSTTYRPMVYAYGCFGGVIDTLQWEGFREGVDDIRYATLMTDLARKAQSSSDVSVRYLGGKAMQMLAQLDRSSFDQETCRQEMIRFIEALRSCVTANPPKSDWALVSGAARDAAKIRIEKGLAKELTEVKANLASAVRPDQTNAVHRKIAATYAKYFRFAEAGDYLTHVGLGLEGTKYYAYLSDRNEDAARLAAFRSKVGDVRTRREAFWLLLPNHPELAESFDEVIFADFNKANTNELKRALNSAFWELGVRRNCLWQERFESFMRVYEKTVAWANRLGIPISVALAKNAFAAYLQSGRPTEAVQAALAGLADPKATPSDCYYLRLAALLGGLTEDDAPTVRETILAFDAQVGADVPRKDRADALCAIGGSLRSRGDERLVRALEEVRQSVCRIFPKRRYTVTFSDRIIDGIGDYDRLSAEEAVCDRRYGGSLEFLETDVTTGTRAAGSSAKETLPDTRMKIVADANGLHIFFVENDPKARSVELGLLSGGSYECYIAPGANEPYVCLCLDPQSGEHTFFNTTYPTFGRRRLEVNENGRGYRFETRREGGRMISHLFLSWRTWATKVPQDGSMWDFENLHWSRTGNSCWNGLESIHGRSTWGELEFRLTRSQRSQILKSLLGQARTDFLAERVSGAHEGCFSHWRDEVVGDPAFYAAELKPLEDELTALCDLVQPEMTDDVVERLAREALPRWADITFEVQRRRARWLERQKFEKMGEEKGK